MRGHLLSKARLQDVVLLLKPFREVSGVATSSDITPCSIMECGSKALYRQTNVTIQRMLTTSGLASQDSTADELHVSSTSTSNNSNSMDFPGGRVPFTDQLRFEGGPFNQRPPLSCYRTLDSKGASQSLSTPLQLLIASSVASVGP